ncbi:MAG: hypothetical protein IBX47_01095 [Desulfuromonadales bacterium]|nr:hypothetical protein [Desulfuromonadales bacterium]
MDDVVAHNDLSPVATKKSHGISVAMALVYSVRACQVDLNRTIAEQRTAKGEAAAIRARTADIRKQ